MIFQISKSLFTKIKKKYFYENSNLMFRIEISHSEHGKKTYLKKNLA